jgi:uncharacterized protein DUF6983
MSVVEIPLTNDPNQSLAVTLPGDTQNIPVRLYVSWNRIAEYWTLSISDSSDTPLIVGIPMLASDGIYGDLLVQSKYLDLGTFFINPLSNNLDGTPQLGDWGVNYTLCWGD